MSDELSRQIKTHFAALTDPRRRKVAYPLINIVTIALCAVIAGADDFVTIAAWGRNKRAWLARFLDLTSGIPSHDRFNALFTAIKPDEFERCLLGWITALHEITAGQVVAIDGKTLRQSFDRPTPSPPSTWSAPGRPPTTSAWGRSSSIRRATRSPPSPSCWSSWSLRLPGDHRRDGLSDGDRREDRRGQADYVLAVKANQPTLREGIESFFLDHMEDDFARVKISRYETKEKGHGRSEHRTYYVCEVPEELPDRAAGRA